MKIGIFTSLFGDWPLEQVARHVAALGYEAVELPAWAGNGHLDLEKVLTGGGKETRRLLADHGLVISAISHGVAGQLSMGPHDSSTDSWAPGMSPEQKVAHAIEELRKSAQAAAELEVPVVTGLIGSHVWDKWYIFPPANEKLYEEGFALLAERWNLILDEFKKYGVEWALKVHPTGIAYNIETAQQALAALGGRPEFGFNPARKYGRFGLAMGLTPRLLHERFGLHFGERFHRDVVHRVESLKEADRLVWKSFREIGLGYENPFPRATIEPFGHRFVPVLYGCRCVYAAAEEPAVLSRPLDPEAIRSLPPWSDARFETEEAVPEVLAQARLSRERYGEAVAAAQALVHNPHFQPLSSFQNLGSVINTAVSVFGAEALCLYAEDPELLKRFYQNVTELMLTALRVFPARDGRRLREVFVWDCTVAMVCPHDYARCNLDFDRELAEFARSIGASFLVHQDSNVTPHLANYARLGYVQGLDFGQDTDFVQAARLFPGASANCILFPAWLQATPIEAVEEELERLMRIGLGFGDFTFSIFEVDPALAEGKVFEFVDVFRKAAERVSQGGDK